MKSKWLKILKDRNKGSSVQQYLRLRLASHINFHPGFTTPSLVRHEYTVKQWLPAGCSAWTVSRDTEGSSSGSSSGPRSWGVNSGGELSSADGARPPGWASSWDSLNASGLVVAESTTSCVAMDPEGSGTSGRPTGFFRESGGASVWAHASSLLELWAAAAASDVLWGGGESTSLGFSRVPWSLPVSSPGSSPVLSSSLDQVCKE